RFDLILSQRILFIVQNPWPHALFRHEAFFMFLQSCFVRLLFRVSPPCLFPLHSCRFRCQNNVLIFH
ncbi:MAG: hypothetical protein DSY70_04905, partial [Desulfobulbus sp.]